MYRLFSRGWRHLSLAILHVKENHHETGLDKKEITLKALATPARASLAHRATAAMDTIAGKPTQTIHQTWNEALLKRRLML
jgi:hypothetical protein